MKNKKLLMLTIGCLMLLTLTGCTKIPEVDGQVVLIKTSTTFTEIMKEGLLEALLQYPIAQAINYLTPVLANSVALAITVVSILVNGIVVALTFKQNVQMQKMQELQGEQKRIQTKYEGRNDQASKMRMQQELMALYKKHDVNPAGSFLALFIQLPVLFAVYAAVRRSEAVNTGSFLGASLIETNKQGLLGMNWVVIVVFVLMIVSQIAASKLPQVLSANREKKRCQIQHRVYKPAENQMGMLIYMMPVFIAFLLLGWPFAISLYYLIYSLINIAKTLIIDKLTNKGDN